MVRQKKIFLWVLVLLGIVWAATTTTQRIVIIGDSTVCNYGTSYYPQTGWGQVLSLYFNSGSVSVTNMALGGRSSRSFVTTGRWDATVALLKAGDILMIQFGHNDRNYSDTSRYADTITYKTYLAKYVTEARALGVHPVFVTPMNMNTWTNSTTVREVFTEGASNYRIAMIHVGDSLKVPVLDLEKKSKALMDTMGQTYMAKFHFLGLDTGEYANFPTGASDGTHFQELGALENARMVVEEISRQPNDSILKLLAPLVAPLYTVTVVTNNTAGGTITKTRRYPKGATVTLKAKPSTGKTFSYWANAKGLSVTTGKRYTFVQDTLPSTWQAVWSGTAPLVLSSSSTAASSAALSSSLAVSSSKASSSSQGSVVIASAPAVHSANLQWTVDANQIQVQIPRSGFWSLQAVDLQGRVGFQWQGYYTAGERLVARVSTPASYRLRVLVKPY